MDTLQNTNNAILRYHTIRVACSGVIWWNKCLVLDDSVKIFYTTGACLIFSILFGTKEKLDCFIIHQNENKLFYKI
jgi:hypothetical protein